MNSITGTALSVWTDTHSCLSVPLQEKHHQHPNAITLPAKTSSHCHFGSDQGANSICDEVSDVLLCRVQRQCDRISYRWTFVAQYASLPAHRAFYVNYSKALHGSSHEG